MQLWDLVLVEESRIAGVGDLAVPDFRKRREVVGLRFIRADNVEDLPANGHELIGNQTAVTLPG